MVHAAPAAIKRNARLPRTNATSGTHAARRTSALRHRRSTRAPATRRPGTGSPIAPANLPAVSPYHRMPERPRDETARHGKHRYQAAHDRDQHRNGGEPVGDKTAECLAPGGEVGGDLGALVCQLSNLRREDGGGTSELVLRNGRIARDDVRCRSSHTEKRFELRRLGPEPVARELRAKVRRHVLLRCSSLLLSLELGIGTRVSEPRHPPHERLRRSNCASLFLEGSRDHGKHHGQDEEKHARRHRRHHWWQCTTDA